MAQPVYAFDEWTKKDITLQGIDAALHVVDWLQTREIAKNDKYYETNPILGKHPSTRNVDMYFASTLLIKTVITHMLPGKYRTLWQSGTIGLSAYCVGRNYRLGIRINF